MLAQSLLLLILLLLLLLLKMLLRLLGQAAVLACIHTCVCTSMHKCILIYDYKYKVVTHVLAGDVTVVDGGGSLRVEAVAEQVTSVLVANQMCVCGARGGVGGGLTHINTLSPSNNIYSVYITRLNHLRRVPY
jgi:hypothetical protein